MMNQQQFVNMMLQMHPAVRNNPMIQAVLNNDSKKGIEIAENLCKSYGVSKEDAINMSTQWAQGLMNGSNRGSRYF